MKYKGVQHQHHSHAYPSTSTSTNTTINHRNNATSPILVKSAPQPHNKNKGRGVESSASLSLAKSQKQVGLAGFSPITPVTSLLPKTSPSPRKTKLKHSRNRQNNNDEVEVTIVQSNYVKIISSGVLSVQNLQVNYIIKLFHDEYFLISLVIVSTNQKWDIFVTISEELLELFRIWSISSNSENDSTLGKWILSCTELQFTDENAISNATFNHNRFKKKYTAELSKVVVRAGTKLQAFFRMAKCRTQYLNLETTSSLNGKHSTVYANASKQKFVMPTKKKFHLKTKGGSNKMEMITPYLPSTSNISMQKRARINDEILSIRNEMETTMSTFFTELNSLRKTISGENNNLEQPSYYGSVTTSSIQQDTSKYGEDITDLRQELSSMNEILRQIMSQLSIVSPIVDHNLKLDKPNLQLEISSGKLNEAATKIQSNLRILLQKRKALKHNQKIKKEMMLELSQVQTLDNIGSLLDLLTRGAELGDVKVVGTTVVRIMQLSRIMDSSDDSRAVALFSHLKLLIKTMNSFLSIADIQIGVTHILLKLVEVSAVDTLVETICKGGICETLLLSLDRHYSSSGICQSLLEFTTKLAQKSVNAKSRFGVKKGCECLEKLIQTHNSDSSLINRAVKLITVLSSDSTLMKDRMYDSRVTNQVFECIERFVSDTATLKSILKASISLIDDLHHKNGYVFSSVTACQSYRRCFDKLKNLPSGLKHFCGFLLNVFGKRENMLKNFQGLSLSAAIMTIFKSPESKEQHKSILLFLYILFANDVMKNEFIASGWENELQSFLSNCNDQSLKQSAQTTLARLTSDESSRSQDNNRRISSSTQLTFEAPPSLQKLNSMKSFRSIDSIQDSSIDLLNAPSIDNINQPSVDEKDLRVEQEGIIKKQRSMDLYDKLKKRAISIISSNKAEIDNTQNMRLAALLKIVVTTTDPDIIGEALKLALELFNLDLATKSTERVAFLLSQKEEAEVPFIRKIVQNLDCFSDLMTLFKSYTVVQLNCLNSLLGLFSHSETKSNLILNRRARDAVVSALINHSNQKDIIVVGLNFLCYLTTGKKIENKLEICIDRTVMALNNIMSLFAADAQIIKRCCRLISNLCDGCPSNKDILGQLVTDSIVTCLLQNFSDVEILMVLFRAVSSLCSQGHYANQTVFGSSKTISVFTEVLRNCGGNNILEAHCAIIMAICSNRSDIKANIVGSGLIREYAKSLDSETITARIVEMIASILKSFIMIPEIKEECFETDVVQKLVTIEKRGLPELRPSCKSLISDLHRQLNASVSNSRASGRSSTKSPATSKNPSVNNTASHASPIHNDYSSTSVSIIEQSEITDISVDKNSFPPEKELPLSSELNQKQQSLPNMDKSAGQESVVDKLLKEIGQTTDHEIILNALRVAGDENSADLAILAMKRSLILMKDITDINATEELPKIVESLQINPNLIIKIMDLQPDKIEVQVQAISLIVLLTYLTKGAIRAYKYGFCERLIDRLSNMASNEKICLSGLKYASLLTNGKKIEHKMRFSNDATINSIKSILRTHPYHVEIMECLCQFISNICDGCVANQDLVGNSSLCNELISNMKNNKNSTPIVTALAKSISIICKNNHTLTQSDLGTSENFSVIVEAINCNAGDEKAFEVLSIMILAICSNRPDLKQNLANCGLSKCLQNILSRPNVSKKAIETIILLIQYLSSEPSIREEFVKGGFINILRDLPFSRGSSRIKKFSEIALKTLIGDTDTNPNPSQS